jgi:hypothetical protein
MPVLVQSLLGYVTTRIVDLSERNLLSRPTQLRSEIRALRVALANQAVLNIRSSVPKIALSLTILEGIGSRI